MMEAAAGRRAFFRLLAREAVVQVDQARGVPQLRLSDLPALPDEGMGALAPMILPGVEILPGEREIRARLKPDAGTVLLFRRQELEDFLFNRFNGRNTLKAISKELAELRGVAPADAFSLARTFFLRLVALRVCVPGNPAP